MARSANSLNSSQAIQSQFAYSAFGEQTKLAGTGPDADFGYAGMYLHPRSGLNLTLFRQYAPQLGRWLSRDPLGSINAYQYASNAPVSFVDPLGLCDSSDPFQGGNIFTPGINNLKDPRFRTAIVLTAATIGIALGAAGAVAGFDATLGVGGTSALTEASGEGVSTPRYIYRTGSQTNEQLTDPTGVSFRDSVSSAANGAQTLRPGDKIYAVDTNQLPSGSVRYDNSPPGHVSVSATPDQIRGAVVSQGAGNPLGDLGLKPLETGSAYRLPK